MALQEWEFDLAHSSISFWVRHLMISKVRGRFSAWTGSLRFDGQVRAGTVEVQIDAASIDTKEAQRDGHLCSSDFLDVVNHPRISYRSVAVEPLAPKRFLIRGELEIRGTTRPVVLDVEYLGRVRDPWGGERVGFSARTSIRREDFGLTWNQALDAGGVVVGDDVTISIEVEALKKV